MFLFFSGLWLSFSLNLREVSGLQVLISVWIVDFGNSWREIKCIFKCEVDINKPLETRNKYGLYFKHTPKAHMLSVWSPVFGQLESGRTSWERALRLKTCRGMVFEGGIGTLDPFFLFASRSQRGVHSHHDIVPHHCPRNKKVQWQWTEASETVTKVTLPSFKLFILMSLSHQCKLKGTLLSTPMA